MKLCALLHETARSGGHCPTCGGVVNSKGKAYETSPDNLVFPDKEGKWNIGGEKLDSEQAKARSATQSYNKIIPTTQAFDKVLPTDERSKRKKRRNPKGALQAILRHRRDIAQRERGGE